MQFRVRIGFTEKKTSVGHDEKKDKTATSVQCSVGDEGNVLQIFINGGCEVKKALSFVFEVKQGTPDLKDV